MEGENSLRGEPPARNASAAKRRKVGGRLFGGEKGQGPSVPFNRSERFGHFTMKRIGAFSIAPRQRESGNSRRAKAEKGPPQELQHSGPKGERDRPPRPSRSPSLNVYGLPHCFPRFKLLGEWRETTISPPGRATSIRRHATYQALIKICHTYLTRLLTSVYSHIRQVGAARPLPFAYWRNNDHHRR
ncbi:hypothetical protein SAMN03159448_05920 [Sinorhizobium sp. NFACC03]|nr:hypothetical protein SAMN03159448_05920 [Sinorhizobium sp. NFACC03]